MRERTSLGGSRTKRRIAGPGRAFPHVVERVGLDETHADLIEIRVVARQLQRLFVEIDAGHFGRLASAWPARRIHRYSSTGPTPCGRGKIRPAAGGSRAVAEEPRLVPAGETHAEPVPYSGSSSAPAIPARPSPAAASFLAEELRTGADERVPRVAQDGQPLQDGLRPQIHSQRIGFGREHVAQPIDHQPGQPVGLGMDQPIGVARLIEPQQSRRRRTASSSRACQRASSGRSAPWNTIRTAISLRGL